MPTLETFFPPPLKLQDYPSVESCRPSGSPSPTKKRRVSSSSSSNNRDDLLQNRINSTLRLRDVWSDIARRHSSFQAPALPSAAIAAGTASTAAARGGQGKHRPTGRTRAVPVDQDDIIDLRTLTIVQDRGMLRRSKIGSFAIGGRCSNQVRVGRDTGTPSGRRGEFRVMPDEVDDTEANSSGGEEDEDWEDEDEVSWEEPIPGETDSEDELAEFDDLQSLPSLKYREERRKVEERRKELKSFWEQELEWTGTSAWDQTPQTRESSSFISPRDSRHSAAPNEVLDRPVQPPQSREEFRREFLKSCTPKPRSQSMLPGLPPSSTLDLLEEEDEDRVDEMCMDFTPVTSSRSYSSAPSSVPSRLRTQFDRSAPLTPLSFSRSPSSASPLSRSITATTIRRKIETLDLTTSPPLLPLRPSSSDTPTATTVSTSPYSSTSTRAILSSSPSRFPGDRRAIFTRDSAPPPPPEICMPSRNGVFSDTKFHSKHSSAAETAPNFQTSPLRNSILVSSLSPSRNQESAQIVGKADSPRQRLTTTITKLPLSPPNSKSSIDSFSLEVPSAVPKSPIRKTFDAGTTTSSKSTRIFGDRGDPVDVRSTVSARDDLARHVQQHQRPTPEATPPRPPVPLSHSVPVRELDSNTDVFGTGGRAIGVHSESLEQDNDDHHLDERQKTLDKVKPPAASSTTSASKPKVRRTSVSTCSPSWAGPASGSLSVIGLKGASKPSKTSPASSIPVSFKKKPRKSSNTFEVVPPTPPSRRSTPLGFTLLESRTKKKLGKTKRILNNNSVSPNEKMLGSREGERKGKKPEDHKKRYTRELEEEDDLNCFSCVSPSVTKGALTEETDGDGMRIHGKGKTAEIVTTTKRNYGLSTPPLSKGKPVASVPSTVTTSSDPATTTSLDLNSDVFKVPALPPSSNSAFSSPSSPSKQKSRTHASRSLSMTPSPASRLLLARHIQARSSPSTTLLSTSSRGAQSVTMSPLPRNRLQQGVDVPDKEEEDDDELARSTPAPCAFSPFSTSNEPRKERQDAQLTKGSPRREQSCQSGPGGDTPRKGAEAVQEGENTNRSERRKFSPLASSRSREKSAAMSQTSKTRRSPPMSVPPPPTALTKSKSRGRRSGTVILDQAPVVVEGDDDDELMMMG